MGYAHGGNQKDKHFPPGVPIISKYLPSDDYSNCEKDFLVAAYLPKKPGCNGTLPAPIDPSVAVKSFPGAQIYVSTFSGFGFHWNFLGEAFKMAKALKRDKVSRPAPVASLPGDFRLLLYVLSRASFCSFGQHDQHTKRLLACCTTGTQTSSGCAG